MTSDPEFEERLEALQEDIKGIRQSDPKAPHRGNGGRWSDFVRAWYAEVDDPTMGGGFPRCAQCGSALPCRRPCGDDPEVGVTYG